MSKSFKRLLSSVLAFVMAVTCLTVVNVGSVFAATETVTWDMKTYSKWTDGTNTLSSNSVATTNTTYSTTATDSSSNTYTLSFAGHSSALIDSTKGLNTGGTTTFGTASSNGHFSIDKVPAGATVNVTANANNQSGEDATFTYQLGTDSTSTTDSTKTTQEGHTWSVKNTGNAETTLVFAFSKKALVSAVTMTLADTTVTTDTVDVTVTVNDSDSKAVSGATVTAVDSDEKNYTADSTTGDDGTCTISDVTAGTTLTITATSGSQAGTGTITGVSSTNNTATVTLSDSSSSSSLNPVTIGDYPWSSTALGGNKAGTYNNMFKYSTNGIKDDGTKSHAKLITTSYIKFTVAQNCNLTATTISGPGLKLYSGSDDTTGADLLTGETVELKTGVDYKITGASGTNTWLTNLSFTEIDTATEYKITGKITKADGSTAINGATVSAFGSNNKEYKDTTDSDGTYTLTIPVGVTVSGVTASAEGYQEKSTSEEISTTDTVNLSLDETATVYSISGYVYSAEDGTTPVVGATVVATDSNSDTHEATAVTDSNGKYTVEGIGVDYSVTSIKVTPTDTTYSEREVSVNLNSEATSAPNILLIKTSSTTTGSTLTWSADGTYTDDFLGTLGSKTTDSDNKMSATFAEEIFTVTKDGVQTTTGLTTGQTYYKGYGNKTNNTITPTQSGKLKLYVLAEGNDDRIAIISGGSSDITVNPLCGTTSKTSVTPIEFDVTANTTYTFTKNDTNKSTQGIRIFKAILTTTEGGSTDDTYTVTVNVKNNSDAGVSGVIVQAVTSDGTKTATGGANGVYSLVLPKDATVTKITATPSDSQYSTYSMDNPDITSSTTSYDITLTATEYAKVTVKVGNPDNLSGETVAATILVDGTSRGSKTFTVGADASNITDFVKAEAGQTITIKFAKDSIAQHITNWTGVKSVCFKAKKYELATTASASGNTITFDYYDSMGVRDNLGMPSVVSMPYGLYGYGEYKNSLSSTTGDLAKYAIISGYRYSLKDVGGGNYDPDAEAHSPYADERVLLNKEGGSVQLQVSSDIAEERVMVLMDVSGGQVSVATTDGELYKTATSDAIKSLTAVNTGTKKAMFYIKPDTTITITGNSDTYSVLKSIRLFSIENITSSTNGANYIGTVSDINAATEGAKSVFKDVISGQTLDDGDKIYLLIGTVTDSTNGALVNDEDFLDGIDSVGYTFFSQTAVDGKSAANDNVNTLIYTHGLSPLDEAVTATEIYKGVFNPDYYDSTVDSDTDYAVTDSTKLLVSSDDYKNGYFAYVVAVPEGESYYAYPYTQYTGASNSYDTTGSSKLTLGQ